jgi:magnesium chelatase subunit D
MDKLLREKFIGLPPEKISSAAQTLAKALQDDKGARIGQCTVISCKLHMYQPDSPQEVQILQKLDAGQTFYNRKAAGGVFHADVFHQCGIIDPKFLAHALRAAIRRYHEQWGITGTAKERFIHSDLIDIQTAGGGGRITGSLDYGKKVSLCKAHANHVHITGQLAAENVAGIFYIVQAAEDAILASNLELRCNERIVYMKREGNGAHTDPSAYCTDSDSCLREEPEKLPPVTLQPDDCKRPEAASEPPDPAKEAAKQDKGNAGIAGMAPGVIPENRDDQMLLGLDGKGTIYSSETTRAERKDKEQEKNNGADENFRLEQILKTSKPVPPSFGRRKPSPKGHSGWNQRHRKDKPAVKEPSAGLAVADTVYAAIRRMAEEKRTDFRIGAEDLRYYMRCRSKEKSVCLIIDASASMAGKRIHAAKMLARQLLIFTSQPISIITFQGQAAQVQVSLTRNYRRVEQGLQKIEVAGATPLALGLKAGLQHLKRRKAGCPTIILITDGLPDNPGKSTEESFDDALAVAREIKRVGYELIVIGLKPYLNHLSRLSRAADGTIYVVDELKKQLWSDVIFSGSLENPPGAEP